LLQNFEDNRYNSSVTPEAIFELSATALTARNNEMGLEEKDVASLCGIGKSTKKVGDGFIGPPAP
jgi:hypothetical protein